MHAPAPTARRHPRCAGISLLLVLLTLTLIAVLAAIVVPAYFARYDVTLDNASVLVAHELRAAQSWAAAHAHDVTFQFAANGDGFRVLDADGLVIERNDPRGPFERRFSSDGVFEGVRFEAIDFEPAQAVRFDERGHAQNGGSVAITFQDERRVLRLTPGTGRITLEGLGRAWRDDELR